MHYKKFFSKKTILILLTLFLFFLLLFLALKFNYFKKNIIVDCNVDTIEARKEFNDSLLFDIRGTNVKDLSGDLSYIFLTIPKNTPTISKLTLIDESTMTAKECYINIEKLESINGKKVIIHKSDFSFINICHSPIQENDITWVSFNQETSSKDIKYKSYISYMDSTNKNNFIGEPAFLSRHGNSSWCMGGKKSYNLSLEDSKKLLNDNKDKQYNLIANNMDKTLLRNSVANELARNIGVPNTLNIKYINLFYESEYQGLYLLTEKPKKIMEDSINLDEGDFVFNWIDSDEDAPIYFDGTNSYYTESPNTYVNLISYNKNYNNEYYQTKIDLLINSLKSNDLSYIDIDNWVKYYWVQEITKNYDAWYRNCYTIYDASENMFYMSTPWDFDRGWQYSVTDKDVGVKFEDEYGSISNYGLYLYLFKNDEFKKKCKEIYDEKIIDELDNISIISKNIYDTIREDAYFDYEIKNQNVFEEICFDIELNYGTSYDNAYNNFLNYVSNRNNYIQQNNGIIYNK